MEQQTRPPTTNLVKEPIMSTLHHESLLETCFDEAWESFRVHNKLTVEQMNEIESHEGVQIALRRSAERLFEDLCL